MVEFTFSGFNSGSAVALSATQAGETDMASVQSWGTGVGSITISEVHSGEFVAPFGVILRATGHSGFDENGPAGGDQYDPTHDKFVYIWTVDGSPISLRDTAGVLNIPTAWRDLNTMYGPQAAFVLPAGSHTINLWCVELASGKTAEAQWTETVQDPAAVYTTTRTAVFSNTGDFAGAPGGAVQCTTEAECEAFFSGLSQTGRLLFKRGEDTTFDEIAVNNAGNFRIGAWGAGARPILRTESGQIFRINSSVGTTDMVIESLRMLGTWDASREAGKPISGPFSWFDTSETDAHLLQCDVELQGNQAPFAATTGARHIMYDCYFHDWGGGSGRYGILQRAEYCAVVATAFHDDPHACLGAGIDDSNVFLNYGAPFRDSGSNNQKTSLAASSFFCASGWSGAGGGLMAAQPALRLNTDGDTNSRWSLDRVVAEGGFKVIDGVESGSRTTHATNFIADKLLVVPTSNLGAAGATEGIIQWSFNGSWRNVYVYMSDTIRYESGDARDAFNINLVGSENSELPDAPVRIYNSTVYNASTISAVLFSNIDASYTDDTVENNIEQDAEGGQTMDAPFDTGTALAGFSPISRVGQRFSVRKPLVSIGGSVSGSGGTMNVSYPTRYYVTSSGAQTSETLANTDFDDSDIHAVYVNGNYYYAEDGDFDVDTSSASNAVITNNSGDTWTGNAVVNLVPNAAANPTVSTLGLPATIPIPYPDTGSAALDDATTGLTAYDNFLGTVRPSPANRGAFEDA